MSPEPVTRNPKLLNILLLNWRDVAHPKSGGAEYVTMEHARGWVKRGHTVTWVTAWYDGAIRNEVVDGVRFIRRMGSLSIYLYVFFYVLLHGRSYDVIVDEVHGFPFFTPLVTRTSVVVFIHEIAGEIWDFMFTFPKNIIGKLLEKIYFRLYRHCQFWTDANSTVEELVERGIPKKQCLAIPCPIPSDSGYMIMDAELNVKDPKSKIQDQGSKIQNPSSKIKYPISKIHKEKNPTFIFVSRVVRMKGIEEVIKAFAFVFRNTPKSTLWIVGSGEESYIAELKTMIDEYGVSGNVQFLGNISDSEKYDRMCRAHVLLHASVKEGWGLVVLEAASVGTPAVVYNVPGLRDVVKHRKTGIVIDTNSPASMAKEALLLLDDQRRYEAYQIQGRKWVNSLTWGSVVYESESLLYKASGK